jgi:hypothetical protein
MKKLIGESGQPQYGLIDAGVDEVNYLDFDLRSPMDRPLGLGRRRRRFNQFQFVSLLSPELIVGVAIVDLGLVGNAFVYLYEPATGQFDEFSFLQPFARRTSIDTFPSNGQAVFGKGANHISISADKVAGQRSLRVSLASGVTLDADLDEGVGYAPLALCTRAGYDGWVFTQKAAGLPVRGQVNWRGRNIDLAEVGALAGVDWTGGYMRRETFWNWGCLSCFLPDGRRLGFNLAAGVNETGFTENTLWLDGKMIKVDMVDFQFDRYDSDVPWRMRSGDGVIDLHFSPAGRRQEKVNAGLIASNFSQYFGRYRGRIVLPDETVELDGAWGLAEDHYARW